MTTTFVNETRVCGKTVEGFGEYATTWTERELKCPECGDEVLRNW